MRVAIALAAGVIASVPDAAQSSAEQSPLTQTMCTSTLAIRAPAIRILCCRSASARRVVTCSKVGTPTHTTLAEPAWPERWSWAKAANHHVFTYARRQWSGWRAVHRADGALPDSVIYGPEFPNSSLFHYGRWQPIKVEASPMTTRS